jgi:hypothetical protein
MAGPAIVVVASTITLWLAFVSNDGLVADDYYKQGLAINQTLSRDATAKALAYRAQVVFDADFRAIAVTLDNAPISANLILRVVHPTRPGLDLTLSLTAGNAGHYEARFPALIVGRWHLILEDRERTWRLAADIQVPRQTSVTLEARR